MVLCAFYNKKKMEKSFRYIQYELGDTENKFNLVRGHSKKKIILSFRMCE